MRLADIQLPVADVLAPIRVDGERAVHWQQNAVEVWVVQQCVIRQGRDDSPGEMKPSCGSIMVPR